MNEIEYTLQKGDILSIPPNTLHYGFKESPGKSVFYYLHFSYKGTGFFSDLPIYTRKYGNIYKLHELHHFSLDPNISDIIKDIKCADILSDIFLLTENEMLHNLNGHKIASEIKMWIPSNLVNAATIKEVAAHFGYNADYLARLFYNKFNISLKTYIRNCRISEIKNLLLNSNFKMNEIAQRTGFWDSLSMVRFFKYYEKCTPTEYRNNFFRTEIRNK